MIPAVMLAGGVAALVWLRHRPAGPLRIPGWIGALKGWLFHPKCAWCPRRFANTIDRAVHERHHLH